MYAASRDLLPFSGALAFWVSLPPAHCSPLPAGSEGGLPRSRSQQLSLSHTPLYRDCKLRKCALIGRRASRAPAPPSSSVGKGRRRLASLSGSACPCKQRPRAGWLGKAAGGGAQGTPGRARGRGCWGGQRHTGRGSREDNNTPGVGDEGHKELTGTEQVCVCTCVCRRGVVPGYTQKGLWNPEYPRGIGGLRIRWKTP